jgi:hypothetical protein
MLEDYKDDQDNLVKAIYYLGLIAPQQFSPLYLNLFKDVLSHKDPIVRSAVITAIGYVGNASIQRFTRTSSKLRS